MALVAMLIVVALMSMAMVRSSASQQRATSITAIEQQNGLAIEALRGLEQASLQLLNQQTTAVTEVPVNLPVNGSDPQHPFTIGLATLTALPMPARAELIPLQSRLNLNNLATKEGPAETLSTIAGAGQRSNPFRAVLHTLFEQQQVDTKLLDAIHDWVDADSNRRYPDGAEDGYYLRLRPAYRAANQPMAAITELRSIRHISSADYQQLSHWLTALPVGADLNVNLASAPVLQALHPQLTVAAAEKLVSRRSSQPYTSVEEFLRADELAGLGVRNTGLAVSSDYWMLRSEFHFDDRVTVYRTLFEIGEQGARLLQRHLGESS